VTDKGSARLRSATLHLSRFLPTPGAKDGSVNQAEDDRAEPILARASKEMSGLVEPGHRSIGLGFDDFVTSAIIFGQETRNSNLQQVMPLS
jgi:hypothetical protein